MKSEERHFIAVAVDTKRKKWHKQCMIKRDTKRLKQSENSTDNPAREDISVCTYGMLMMESNNEISL